MLLNAHGFLCVLICLTTSTVVPSALAQALPRKPDVQASSSARPAVKAPVPSRHQRVYAQPSAQTAPRTRSDETEEKALDKAGHLRLAAEHLKAAGHAQLAKQVAKEAELEAKLHQLRKLQAQIEELRAAVLPEKTITLHVKIMELQVSKMRKLGFEFQFADGASFEEALAHPCAVGLMETLRQHDLVKVLAEPTLVTVSGRPASFQSGGEFPIVVPQSLGTVAVEYRQFGTRMDCLAEVLESGRIRLELRPSVSEIDMSRSVVVQDTSIPGLRTRRADIAVEVEAGRTVLVGGMTRKQPQTESDADEVEETTLLVAVTAHLGPPPLQAGKAAETEHR